MQPGSARDKHRFFLRNLWVWNAAVHRAYGGALLFLEEANALGALVRHDVVNVLSKRWMLDAAQLPLLSAFIDGGVRTFARASAAVDALLGYQRRHNISLAAAAGPSATNPSLGLPARLSARIFLNKLRFLVPNF